MTGDRIGQRGLLPRRSKANRSSCDKRPLCCEDGGSARQEQDVLFGLGPGGSSSVAPPGGISAASPVLHEILRAGRLRRERCPRAAAQLRLAVLKDERPGPVSSRRRSADLTYGPVRVSAGSSPCPTRRPGRPVPGC